MSLNERRALVTGAASGIGRAVASRLLEEGAHVVAFDRRACDIQHARLRSVCGDVAVGADVDRLFASIHDTFGGLEVLVSNAGVGVHERLGEGDPEAWQRLLDTNVSGTLRIVRAFAPLLEQEDGGDAVFVSSVAARKTYPWGGPYAASKAAVEQIAETLRQESLPQVRVATIAPGMVASGFFDSAANGGTTPRPEEVGWTPLQPEDVADLVAYVLSRPAHMAINHLTVRPRDQDF